MSGYERSKAPLALMEQVIMILVFALASAVCLQAFVYSDRLSRADEQRQNAMAKAQQVTEYCKANHGDLEKAGGILGADVTEEGLEIRYPEEKMILALQLTERTDYLQKAVIIVSDMEDAEIYNMDIAYQIGGQP